MSHNDIWLIEVNDICHVDDIDHINCKRDIDDIDDVDDIDQHPVSKSILGYSPDSNLGNNG